MYSSHFGLNWYEKQQRQREERRKKSETSLLNRNVQQLIQRMIGLSEAEVPEEWVLEANRHLVQSSILHLSYANNFESPKVVAVQLLFGRKLVTLIDENNRNYFLNELDHFETRLNYLSLDDYQWYAMELNNFR